MYDFLLKKSNNFDTLNCLLMIYFKYIYKLNPKYFNYNKHQINFFNFQ